MNLLHRYLARYDGPLARLLRATFTKAQPDPWSREIDVAVRSREFPPLCLNCTYPQEGHQWFCPNCGFAAGEFVTTMPYLYIFALGEVMRRGVIGPPERSFARTATYVLLSAFEYTVFAPVYWFWMVRKARGNPICRSCGREFEFDEPA